MNRPNKELLTEWSLNSYADYTNELEKYCDELEKWDERLTKALVNINKSFCDDIERLEKALDKACEQFEDCPFIMLGEELGCCDECADEYVKCWKEWAFKDE